MENTPKVKTNSLFFKLLQEIVVFYRYFLQKMNRQRRIPYLIKIYYPYVFVSVIIKRSFMQNPNNLIWIDLEMTGLNPDKDVIIEVASLITDSELNLLAEGPVIAIHQPSAVLEAMDEWNTTQHGRSGLTQRVVDSQLSAADAEEMTLDFFKQWVPAKCSPICGNSICQDRRFLYRLMPKLEAYFHYRNLDVSTLKELVKRWQPNILNNFKKNNSHLAMDDIKDSLAELKHYRQYFIRQPE